MPAVTNGAKLVKLLKESGTGADKLDVARRVLFDAKADGRIATSDEVIAGLEDHFGPFHATVAKAKAIAETGELPTVSAAQAASIEDELAEMDAPPAVGARKRSKKAGESE